MNYVYTEKAERDGVGAAGEVTTAEDDELRYQIVHGYAVAGPEDKKGKAKSATVKAAPEDGMVRK